MARIIGNIVPEDDFTHPLGPEPRIAGQTAPAGLHGFEGRIVVTAGDQGQQGTEEQAQQGSHHDSLQVPAV